MKIRSRITRKAKAAQSSADPIQATAKKSPAPERRDVPLSASEVSVIDNLQAGSAGMPKEYIVEVEGILQRNRALLTEVTEVSPQHLHLGQLALLGAVYRTHELLLGGLEQVARGHKHVWAGCLRGLVETFGALAFATDAPDRLTSLVTGPGIGVGKLREAAKRRMRDLREDVDWLDSIVHPGTTSFFLGVRIIDEAERRTLFGIPPAPLSHEEVARAVDALIGVCQLIQKEIGKFLTDHRSALTVGEPAGHVVLRGGEIAAAPDEPNSSN
jgi:hypothetical protein